MGASCKIATLAALASSLLACSAFDDALSNGRFGPDSDNGVPCPDAETPDGCGVITLVNQERANEGVAALRFDPSLARAAQAHAADMVQNDYFEHISPDGRDFSDRAEAAGYQGFATGENIAQGQASAAEVMRSWMNSDGHRRNILSSSSNEIGVGVEQRTWVQVFGSH
jgi:uncharacterized protein YkwD